MQTLGYEKGGYGWMKYIIINYEARRKTEFDVSAALRILYIF